MMNDCTPKLSACNANCTDDPCKAACKSSFNSCGSTHRSECLTCATGENSCDPDVDCYVPVM
jgi:hypothetical protein